MATTSWLAFSLGLLALGCGGSTANNNDWQTLHRCTGNEPQDDILVATMIVEGDELVVDAGHAGGCAEHSYGLCYSDAWAESDPVQVELHLLHDDGGDTCEAYLTPQLRFGLEPLRKQYEEYYQITEGAIALQLDEHEALYKFGGEQLEVPSWDEIDASLDELNHCEEVSDCKGIPAQGCSFAYINADEDSLLVESQIKARKIADTGSDNFSCPANCRCGLLTCDAGRCTTSESDCGTTEPKESEQSICL